MKAALIGLACLVVAGCSKADPITERFANGDTAVVVDFWQKPEEERKGPVTFLSGEIHSAHVSKHMTIALDGSNWTMRNIDVGTRLRILDDADKGDDNPSRQVAVKVLDGDEQGAVGVMFRIHLRRAK